MNCGEDICEEAKFTDVIVKDGREVKCPPHKEAIGRAGWGLLHTIAAHYPDAPDDECKDKHARFLKAFAKVYPCRSCGQHFQYMMKGDPPRLENRKEISEWTCRMHNGVNEMLNKTVLPCELSLLDLRWRLGNAPCTSFINSVG